MDTKNIDKSFLKSLLREIIREDIGLFKDTIKENLIKNQSIVTEEQGARRQRLEKLVDRDFKQYDEVFRALA